MSGEEIRFTATEFRLLHFLAAHPGRVFTREQLINRIIGDAADQVPHCDPGVVKLCAPPRQSRGDSCFH